MSKTLLIRTLSIVLMVAGLLSAPSCKKEKQIVHVSSIEVAPATAELTEGESTTLTATVLPENADDKVYYWSSSDNQVASVSESGEVFAVKPGKAVIKARARDNDIEGSCTVTVIKKIIAVASVSLDKETLELTEGGSYSFTATVLPEDADDKSLTWDSSDKEVATVDKNGVVTAVKPGKSTITATSVFDSKKKASCELTVVEKLIPVESITLDKESFSLTVGQNYTLSATVLPDNASDKSLTWESNDTDGMQLLLNFALNVCGCTRWWDFEGYMDRTVEDIRSAVGEGRAICALTGGLDSAVAAMLAHRALGGRLQCIFIDTGLMRENEASRFLAYFRDQAGLNIAPIQAQDRFLTALSGVADPGQKRRIIAEALQSTLDEAAESLGQFTAILRATTCTDLMEGKDALSRPGLRGDLPMLEPLRELFKDEVRQVGARLDIPEAILQRPSFPGSGLALRILGEVTPARLQTLRAADQIFTGEIADSGLGRRMRHYFAVLTPLPENDTQSAVILRAVQAGESAQQAYAARLPYDLLERVTERILRERPEVVRVVYDLSPSTHTRGVEWQ